MNHFLKKIDEVYVKAHLFSHQRVLKPMQTFHNMHFPSLMFLKPVCLELRFLYPDNLIFEIFPFYLQNRVRAPI